MQTATPSFFSLTDEGFLAEPAIWNEALAAELAQRDGLIMDEDHWTVIHHLRYFYHQFQRHPTLRLLIKQLTQNWTAEKANSIYLHQLFPGGVIKQASKIGGLPKPLKCM